MRLAVDTRIIDLAFGNAYARQLQAAFTFLISLAISFTASWQIALVVLAVIPVNIFASIIQLTAISGQQ